MQYGIEKLLAYQHKGESGVGLKLWVRLSPGSFVSPGARPAVALQQPSAESVAQGTGFSSRAHAWGAPLECTPPGCTASDRKGRWSLAASK